MFDKRAFYNAIRHDTPVTKNAQVEGFELILNEAVKRNTPRADLAYMLATVWWETNHTMQPIKEAYWLSENYRKTHFRYYPFYGRGYVQLTWDYNYKKVTEYFQNVLHIDVDFVKNPELVMLPKYAVIILFVGMEEGWFTGHNLDDYIDNVDESEKEDLREFSNARHIINGSDHDVEIGELAVVYNDALKVAQYGTPAEEPKEEKEVPMNEPELPNTTHTKVAAGTVIGGSLALIAATFFDKIEHLAHLLWSLI